MSYPKIAARVYREPWMIAPSHHAAIVAALQHRMEGLERDVKQAAQEKTRAQAPSLTGKRPMFEPYLADSSLVVPVMGILGKHLSGLEMLCGGFDVDTLNGTLREAAQDSNIQSVVLDLSSPGGTVSGIPEAAETIARVAEQKPVVAFTDHMAHSAGYYLASQAGAIYLTPSAVLGSIGVYALYLDASEAMAAAGERVNAIVSGEMKLAGAPFKPMSETERAYLQESVDTMAAMFRGAVKDKRPGVTEEALDGRILLAQAAVESGLADGIVEDLSEVLAML